VVLAGVDTSETRVDGRLSCFSRSPLFESLNVDDGSPLTAFIFVMI
jgi:hypothetical protein